MTVGGPIVEKLRELLFKGDFKPKLIERVFVRLWSTYPENLVNGFSARHNFNIHINVSVKLDIKGGVYNEGCTFGRGAKGGLFAVGLKDKGGLLGPFNFFAVFKSYKAHRSR